MLESGSFSLGVRILENILGKEVVQLYIQLIASLLNNKEKLKRFLK
jgi:hypothetical protein